MAVNLEAVKVAEMQSMQEDCGECGTSVPAGSVAETQQHIVEETVCATQDTQPLAIVPVAETQHALEETACATQPDNESLPATQTQHSDAVNTSLEHHTKVAPWLSVS